MLYFLTLIFLDSCIFLKQWKVLSQVSTWNDISEGTERRNKSPQLLQYELGKKNKKCENNIQKIYFLNSKYLHFLMKGGTVENKKEFDMKVYFH